MLFRILTPLFLAVLPVAALAWDSVLFPMDTQSGQRQRPVVNFDGRQWQLPDFSYVGYRRGEVPLASGLSCNSSTVSTSGNFADALQQAIDAVGQSGGGTVRIPAGTFTLSRSVAINHSNVSVVGAGSDLTRIQVPSSYNPADDNDEGLFTFGKAIGGWHKGWVDRGNELAEVDQPIAAGSRQIRVANASSLSVGQWVVVTQYFWPAFSQRNSGGAWDSYTGFPPDGSANRESAFAYLRQITAINGRQVSLDVPIGHDLNPANNPVRLRDAESPSWIRMKRNVGIAGLSIEFADNNNGPDSRPTGAAVYFEGVRDGWVYDVQAVNFPRYGVKLNHAARITIRESALKHTQDYGGDGYGYGISVQDAQSVLIDRSYIEDTRHGITTRAALTNDLVISQSESAAGREGGDDTHYGYSHNILWDAHQMTWGTGLQGIYRGTISGGAHETNGTQVLWKLQGDGHRGGWYGGSVQLNPSSDGWNIVVGGPGQHEIWDAGAQLGSGERMTASTGLQTGSGNQSPGPGSRENNVLYEGLFQPGLSPASLYQAQLQQRLGSTVAAFDNSCGAAPTQGSVQPDLRPGPNTLVFDSEHLGFTPAIGSGCEACDRDDPSAARGGAGEGYSMTMSSSNWAIGGDFRGPMLHTDQFASLVLWLRPSTSGFGMRVRLSRQDLPEGQYQSVGDEVLNGLAGGSWQRIEIPMSDFGNGAFNAVELRSIGSASHQRIDLDDIELVPVAPSAACDDGQDNDGDGLIDYPNDPGCDSASDNDEYNAPLAACADGQDNDGDGLIDYPSDPGCDSASDNDEYNAPPAACADGQDNDGDGLVDYPNDPGCDSASDNDEYNAPPAACADGQDNDGDGLVDYPSDPGCDSASDNDEYNAPPQCSDGIDNDGDRLVDGDDPSCSGPQDNSESPNDCASLVQRLLPRCLFAGW